MLEFLKRKKKGEPEDKASSAAQSSGDAGAVSEASAADGTPKKKKRIPIKKLVFIVLTLAAVGGAGYFVYSSYFTDSGPEQRKYKAVALSHVKLPEEMLAFSFTNFPDLYDALVIYNDEVNLFDEEIQRIEAIASQYPEQKKIADSQKKVWEKGKNTLIKAFTKLEKPIKETYVLYQVNKAQGQTRINEKATELTQAAQEALTKAQELTSTLKAQKPKPPEGIVQGTLYKIKKIFL